MTKNSISLIKKIEDYALSLPEFIGMESYTDIATGRFINNYYWETREEIEKLMFNLEHKNARSSDKPWIVGYQTIIAEIIGAKNSNLSHPLSLSAQYIPYQKHTK